MPVKCSNMEKRQRSTEKPTRRIRLKLACARCQRRKIKCDGQLPQCGNCKAADVDCVDGDSTRLGPIGDAHRAQVTELKARIQYLESIIKSRCPDVDLSDTTIGAVQLTDGGVDNDDDGSRETAVPSTSETPAPVTTTTSGTSNDVTTPGLLAHEIGLVSLNTTQDARYIGPSSGYFLARLMLATGRRVGGTAVYQNISNPSASCLPLGLVECLQGPLPLPPIERAKQLCGAYFDMANPQYPILHQASFFSKLEQAYITEPTLVDSFQIFMVIAIGAVIMSQRHRVRLPSESYCLSALQHLEAINVENSVSGLQCLLLLLVFTMHCPNMKLNVWYLNYQCIASVLDLGLQRDVRAGSPGISLIDQEMRTRIFWTVMTIDRRVATMMGRPIGLRDEACDLRLPQGLCDDRVLGTVHPSEKNELGSVEFAIHLFKLTKLISEFKYVANSVVRETPTYAYPAVMDIHQWQRDLCSKLDGWESDIPQSEGSTPFLQQICRLRSLELRMALLRPVPAIPNPTMESLRRCHQAARDALFIHNDLYKSDMLVHSWDMFYSATLTTITLLYCAKAVPGLAQAQSLSEDLDTGLRVLGALGEHWNGAKRCRDILEELGRALVLSLREQPPASFGGSRTQLENPSIDQVVPLDEGHLVDTEGAFSGMMNMSGEFFDNFGIGGLPGDQIGLGDPTDDMETIMRNLFDDFIPTNTGFI